MEILLKSRYHKRLMKKKENGIEDFITYLYLDYYLFWNKWISRFWSSNIIWLESLEVNNAMSGYQPWNYFYIGLSELSNFNAGSGWWVSITSNRTGFIFVGFIIWFFRIRLWDPFLLKRSCAWLTDQQMIN